MISLPKPPMIGTAVLIGDLVDVTTLLLQTYMYDTKPFHFSFLGGISFFILLNYFPCRVSFFGCQSFILNPEKTEQKLENRSLWAKFLFILQLSLAYWHHFTYYSVPCVWTSLWRYDCLCEPPHDKTIKMAFAPSEDLDQPEHSLSLIRVFAVRMKIAWVLSYPLSAQRRLWSDWVDAQADVSLRWAHSHFVGFVMRRLICPCISFMVLLVPSILPSSMLSYLFRQLNIYSFAVPIRLSWSLQEQDKARLYLWVQTTGQTSASW